MRAYVIASVFVILGLIAIIFQNWLGPEHSMYNYVNQLPGVFLVSGVLSFTYKLVEQKDADRKLASLFRLHESVVSSGLDEILNESQAYNFSGIIENAKMLSIVLNDAQRWIGNNAVKLEQRFRTPGTVTRMFTVDPASRFADVLASKLEISTAALEAKIDAGRKAIVDAHAAAGALGKLEIYVLKSFPTHSIFLSEDVAILTPYQTSAGRASVPVMIFVNVKRDDSVYGFVHRDVDKLRKESALVFPGPQS